MKREFLIVLFIVSLFSSCTSTIENPNEEAKDKTDVPVASVSLSRDSAELVEGESITITATVSPNNATDKTVSWSSSKSSVASVDQKGTVSALSVGTTTITASAGRKSSSCTVTVTSKTIAVSGITLDKTELSLNVGEEYQLKATIAPSNASDQSVQWSSASSSIATVNDGLVKGIAVGETTITAHVGGQSAVCTVKICQIDYSKEYLTIEFLTDGRVSFGQYGMDYTLSREIESSADNGQTWIKGMGGDHKKGDKVRIRGMNFTYSSPFASYHFTTTQGTLIRVYGNIMSLIDHNFESLDSFPSGSSSTFEQLFASCNGLVSAKDLVLPKTTSVSCYEGMFRGCNGLTEGPTILPAQKLARGCYRNMFLGCNSLQSAPQLPGIILAESCYEGMFSGCGNLRAAPELNAKDLAESCYASMFSASGLVTSPVLPATIVPFNAYNSMFEECHDLVSVGAIYAKRTISNSNSYHAYDGNLYRMFAECTSLKEVPDLLLSELNERCCEEMFRGCTSLSKAPTLPASIMADACYSGMFRQCSSLTTAPELPATTMAAACYSRMFFNCTSLVKAPTLPAKELNGIACYSSMFEGCTGLKTAPSLPATSITERCYSRMFAECTSLTDAPNILPAMTLAERCYEEMFYNCRSLTTAPVLPATSLVRCSYYRMFYSCIRMNYVKALFIDLSRDSENGSLYWRTHDWLYGVSGEGTFVKNTSAKWNVSGTSGVPDGWAIKYASE